MALRLTGTTSPSGGSAAFGDASGDPSAARLGAQARDALTRGDLGGYRALLAQAAEITDAQRRYQAEVALLEQGLWRAGQAANPAARTFAAVAQGALDVLEREPCEPIVLSYAGIACYELWALDAARSLLDAARRLDPGLAHLERNLAEVVRRRRHAKPARPSHASVPGLARRAAAIARRARPAAGLTLSLCMIVRDEERMLGRCLAAAAPAVDEIVIVDTGSADATVQIARSFGAHVIEQPWTGSFAEARNASFAAATGDWLLYLDADEVLVADDAPRLRELTGHTWREAFYLTETSFVGDLAGGAAIVNSALRMFRNRPAYRFEGRIHEQIAHALPTWAPGRIEHTSVRVEHYGYLGDVRAAKEKSQRNLELLRRQATEGPASAFLHFNLGSEYAAAGHPRSAVEELGRAWAMLSEAGTNRTEEFAPPLIAALVRALRECERPVDAIARAREGQALYPDFTDLVLEQAAAALARGDRDDARELYERCTELGDAPARYGGRVGAGTYLPRLALAGLALERDDPAAARELLEWCMKRHPGFLGVVGPYAAARLREGDAPEQVVEEIGQRLPLTAAARHALARTLAQAGAERAAETQYRRVIDESDGRDADSARVALAERRLRHGAWDEAARLAAAISDEHPRAALACRIETCARLVGGDPAAARVALARGARVGLPGPESTVFDAWIATAEGAPPREGLSVAGVPLMATLLELLLAAGAAPSAGFGQLRGLLERSRLDRREQRQLLAEMHLRHGHLAGAATEWLAVCAQAPDARARLGLAHVAAAQEMPEDAIVFAAAALELDPNCAEARDLLARLRAQQRCLPAAIAAESLVDR